MNDSTPLIDMIRRHPHLYFGSKSLTALCQFLQGFRMACELHGIEDDRLGIKIPKDIDEWVAYRTHFRESTSGCRNMIIATTDSEEEAFDRYFELLEEHSQRVPKLIAEILNPISNSRRMRDGEQFHHIPPPKRIQLVTYTDDPGFFALHESDEWNDRFHPYLSWRWEPSGGELVIHDDEAYSQLLRESEELERERDQWFQEYLAQLPGNAEQDDTPNP